MVNKKLVEALSGKSIEELREMPLSELHEEIRKRNGGRMPETEQVSVHKGHEVVESYRPVVNYDRDAVRATSVPWHERIRNAYYRFFG